MKYTFYCTQERMINFTEEESIVKDINEESAVEIDIQIQGYSNQRERTVVTQTQFEKILSALENEEIYIFGIRCDVGLLSIYNENHKQVLVIDGCIYTDAGYRPNEKSSFLGYGGRRFKYKRFDSDEEVLTNNLWNGTALSELIMKFMPDNAEWIKDGKRYDI